MDLFLQKTLHWSYWNSSRWVICSVQKKWPSEKKEDIPKLRQILTKLYRDTFCTGFPKTDINIINKSMREIRPKNVSKPSVIIMNLLVVEVWVGAWLVQQPKRTRPDLQRYSWGRDGLARVEWGDHLCELEGFIHANLQVTSFQNFKLDTLFQ